MNVEEFAALHVPGDPLLLANAWDLGSARYLYAAGHRVIATTSAGVAYCAGKPDAHGETMDETLALARRCVAAGIPVTVDLESGFSDDPEQAADNVAAFAALGVLGGNIEDGRPDGTLLPLDLAVAKIEAIRARTPEFFVNARTDAYWSGAGGDGAYGVALERALAYQDAGAHGIFVPGVADAATIGRLTGALSAPLNVLFQPAGLSFAQLGELGVGRVSCGSMLFRLSLGTIEQAARDVRAGRFAAPTTMPSYAQLGG